MLTFGVFMPAISLAVNEISEVWEEIWDWRDKDKWFTQGCYETKWKELYDWAIWLYADTFTNTSNKDLYILETKVFWVWQYVKYNNSKKCDNNGQCESWINIFNSKLINENDDVVVHPWSTVLHMTTADTIPWATFVDVPEGWAFTTPFEYGWTSFKHANYRVDWHPTIPTNPNMADKWPYDAEFRTITLYSHDEKFSTPKDNYAIVECQKMVIRWCGDWLLSEQYGEKCDPEAEPWKTNHACDPVTCKGKTPICSSQYNWKQASNLKESDNLCDVWSVSDFKFDEANHKWTWKCDNVAWTSVECSADKSYNWNLKREKTLISATKYVKNVWQELEWELKITAVGGDVKNVVITDKLPKVLSYVSYTSDLPNGVTMNANQPIKTNNDKTIQWKTTWTLKEWESIKLVVKTKVDEMPKKSDNYQNVACAEAEWVSDDCVPVTVPYLRIKKYIMDWNQKVTQKNVKIWEEIEYRIEFGNKWENSSIAPSIKIKDFLPNNVQYISSEIYIDGVKVNTNSTQTTQQWDMIIKEVNVNWLYVDIFGWITLNPWSEWYIILKWKVLGTETTNRQNFACIYEGDDQIGCDDVIYDITTLTCTAPEITTKSFSNWWGSTSVKCTTSSGEKASSIKLDCGAGAVIEWTTVSTLELKDVASIDDTICVYPSNNSSNPISYKVSCEVNNESNDTCKWTVTVDKNSWWWGWSPWCSSITTNPATTTNITSWSDVEVTCKTSGGSAYILIDCDYKEWNKYDETNKNFYVSSSKETSFTRTCKNYTKASKIQCLVKEYPSYSWQSPKTACWTNVTIHSSSSWGWCCSTKWWNGDEIYDCVKCFNINAWNASVEDSEILPIYRNIYKLAAAVKKWHYEEYELKTYPYWKDNLSSMYDKKCTTEWNIAINSMMCEFLITDWMWNEVKRRRSPCLSSKYNSLDNLANAWIAWQRKNYNDDMDSLSPTNGTSYTFRSNVQFINFAELKRQGKITKYWEYKISLEKVDLLWCDGGKWKYAKPYEAVCESNFVLTNPYTVQKTPSWNLKASTDKLGDYLYVNGGQVFYAWNLLKNAIATSENYEPTEQVNKAMSDFINKYKKLAVNVKSEGWKSVKKVPGKNIYFVEWEIDPSKITTLNKPVTFVQTSWNTTIRGNINYNMMLLTNGTITFDWSNTCNSRQVVKWVFYAKWGITRINVPKNDKLTNSQRCTEGWLTIKWVLIWKGLKWMMENSRSNLNDWFNAYTDAKKKKVVMDWASVVIEYSPSVFTKSTMPPGAEYFVTALSIYKN